MDFGLIFSTIRYRFWVDFHANTIDYGLLPNLNHNTIDNAFWLNFYPYTIDWILA